MASPAPTARTHVRRIPQRGAYDRATVDAILDEALVAHVGFALDAQPFVIPMLVARVGGRAYLHGSSASRLLRALADGVPACLTATLTDGLVLARSVFHHSLNYRSVVALGEARLVADPAERAAALEAFTEKLVPGRWAEARPPSAQELKATSIVALGLDEASAKARAGGPADDDEDYALPAWAGVVPLALRAGAPVPDARLAPGTPPSPAALAWAAAHGAPA